MIYELLIVAYLIAGSFLAGMSWDDSYQYPLPWRIGITLFYILILPISLLLGIAWKGVKFLLSPVDNYFQISFFLSFYIFNRKAWAGIETNVLQNMYVMTQEKRNTQSLKDRIYRKCTNILFEKNKFVPDTNYQKESETETNIDDDGE